MYSKPFSVMTLYNRQKMTHRGKLNEKNEFISVIIKINHRKLNRSRKGQVLIPSRSNC